MNLQYVHAYAYVGKHPDMQILSFAIILTSNQIQSAINFAEVLDLGGVALEMLALGLCLEKKTKKNKTQCEDIVLFPRTLRGKL